MLDRRDTDWAPRLFDPGQPGLTDATTDQCPRAPGPIARQGCPSLDGDHDGVLDRDDACPTIAETDNGYQDDDGCPDELPESVQEFSGVIRGINFDVDGATLRPGAAKTLNRAAEVLDAHPGLRVEISGHTDSTGARRHNLELSQARAETVRAYLIERGIDGDRLETAGFGPDRPLADNATREGRLQNRRIEFRILSERAAGPVSTRP